MCLFKPLVNYLIRGLLEIQHVRRSLRATVAHLTAIYKSDQNDLNTFQVRELFSPGQIDTNVSSLNVLEIKTRQAFTFRIE